MLLTQLLQGIQPLAVSGVTEDRWVSSVVFDSRKVEKDSLFVAVRGTQVDGHDYIDKAIAAGATTIVCETMPEGAAAGAMKEPRSEDTPEDAATGGSYIKRQTSNVKRQISFVQVADPANALAHLAAAYYLLPSTDLTLIGITGTNGKTTVATLLHDLFTGLGYKAGLLSTVEVRIGTTVVPATHTTPDAVAINAHLAEMRDAGCDYVFMEVSSHAVDQQRTAGLHFAGGVFTNLSHDHLDYHETFAAYRDAKKGFFDQLPKSAFALVNADDRNGDFMLQNTKARKRHYSLRKVTDYRARLLSNSPQGLQLDLDGTEVFTRLLGRFNAYNLLAAYGVASELGMDRDETLVALSALSAAAGRLDHVADPAGQITAVVDYAHTPDALENVLTTLRDVMPPTGRLLCVVGAGGDRDRTKRPTMARLSAALADQTILTSDNPRTEDPEAILDEMEAGLESAEHRARTLRITDRRAAIRTAVQLARPTDVVLVAGKGHETYQEVNGVRTPFDDKLELANALNARAHVG